jgi:NAD(P)H-dependent FMN reductase
MSNETHVVAVAGSLREESHTQQAIRRAAGAAEDAGASVDVIDLREMEVPVFDADDREVGDAPELTRRVREADSVLLGTPMYHGSYSSVLKNALDYCGFDEFEDTTVGLLCVSGGSFPVTALEHLRSVCRALNAWVIPHQAAVPSAHSAFEDGELVDEDIGDRVDTLGQEVVRYAHIEPDPATFESAENVGADD